MKGADDRAKKLGERLGHSVARDITVPGIREYGAP